MAEPLLQSELAVEGRIGVADVDRAIVEAVAYADVFEYPLTAVEAHRYLIGKTASGPTVKARLAALVSARRLVRRDDLYMLPGREGLASIRRRRAGVSARLWPVGIRYGRRLAQLPFVRMVAITGSLALDNAEAGSDIDYLMVTAAGRVWIGRGSASLLRRMALTRGVRLCPNFVLSEGSLAIRDRNLYTAHELVQMVPVAGRGVYRRLIAANRWTREFLPNVPEEPRRMVAGEVIRHPLAQVAEAALGTSLGNRLDRLERARLTRKMARRAASLAEVEYSDECCKDHVDGHARRILAAYGERVEAAVGARP